MYHEIWFQLKWVDSRTHESFSSHSCFSDQYRLSYYRCIHWVLPTNPLQIVQAVRSAISNIGRRLDSHQLASCSNFSFYQVIVMALLRLTLMFTTVLSLELPVPNKYCTMERVQRMLAYNCYDLRLKDVPQYMRSGVEVRVGPNINIIKSSAFNREDKSQWVAHEGQLAGQMLSGHTKQHKLTNCRQLSSSFCSRTENCVFWKTVAGDCVANIYIHMYLNSFLTKFKHFPDENRCEKRHHFNQKEILSHNYR